MPPCADPAAETTVASPPSQLALDVAAGLASKPKSLPSRYFYDTRGSALFQRITELEEYYPTRCEREILLEHGGSLVSHVGGASLRLIELGAGDGSKTEVLLDRLCGAGVAVTYHPIDICPQVLDDLAVRLRGRMTYPDLKIDPVPGEYSSALRRIAATGGRRNLCLFLGSSIGNLRHSEAARFLRRMARLLNEGDLMLIGFDLKKDPAVLRRAYDDAQGVTREFNLNLLDRLNRELGADFRRNRFLHHCEYHAARGRMESWLVSKVRQEVRVAALARRFSLAAWEGIHVECSHKYDLDQIERFAGITGFDVVDHFFDSRHFFCDSLWQVRP